jgi:hypothetical protein
MPQVRLQGASDEVKGEQSIGYFAAAAQLRAPGIAF